ncbi:hypothetical protein K32_23840 [Kaistia sp. 32K]|uniref:hypothetical protein n=1 Tax=Kaistia sp. 32K TaxID=2795690 RepID=UPI00191556A2|nr:hypothetical protein [Kaistia sp. 32K]BCP53767.1 hypothetical protein K32_23840 [Kaistia sp. 32K]
MHLIFAAALLAVFAYVVAETILKYRSTPGTSLWTAFEGSMQLLWGQILVASGALIAFAAQIADYLNDPSVGDAIKSLVKPEYVPVAVLVVGIAVRWAHSRSRT